MFPLRYLHLGEMRSYYFIYSSPVRFWVSNNHCRIWKKKVGSMRITLFEPRCFLYHQLWNIQHLFMSYQVKKLNGGRHESMKTFLVNYGSISLENQSYTALVITVLNISNFFRFSFSFGGRWKQPLPNHSKVSILLKLSHLKKIFF